jgi:heat-inducible transcriptional repressor
MQLTDREREILATIIEAYIASAAPVASRAVAKRSRLDLSPASMRNVMADLTEKGLLEQPHTSAGRVPTSEAFRVYIDTMLPRPEPSKEIQERIARVLSEAGLEIKDILRQAGRILSDQSHQVSMILAPRYGSVRWKQIEFVLVKTGLVLVVLVLEGGIIQQKLIALEEIVTADDLTKYANYLNELFSNRTVAEVRAHILRELRGARERLSDLCGRALSLVDEAFDKDGPQELYVDGTAYLLRQPDFADLRAMREMFDVLDDRSKLLDILDRVMESNCLCVTLGKETPLQSGTDMGLISSPYTIQGRSLGVISVMGPLRMDYAKVVPMVDYMARILTDILQKRLDQP